MITEQGSKVEVKPTEKLIQAAALDKNKEETASWDTALEKKE